MPAPASASAASALVRLRAQVVKEVLSILRDPRSRMVVLAPPLIQLLLFSFAATLEVRNVDIAVLDQDAGRWSHDWTLPASSPTCARCAAARSCAR